MSEATRQRIVRAVLIVPASNPAMIAKAAASDADQVCIDLEDAVAPDQKGPARQNVIDALRSLDFGGKTRSVRINGVDTPFAYRDLVAVVEQAGPWLDTIIVPKASGANEIRFVDTMLDQIEAACGIRRPIGLEALIETAAGVLNIREVAQASRRLEALIFGSGDFAASMQMAQETIGGLDAHDALYPGHRWHHAMQAIVVAARAHGLRAIDGPYAAFKDADGLERLCAISRSLGFDGKWCIHPNQMTRVCQAFSPSPSEIGWAQEMTAAYAAALADGRGAISVGGKMIDEASLRACRQILARARRAGLAD
ncbi:MAG: CoA ester lyase [Hyphomonadaceae bacterium]|nr:CoA ester lyase [Hyphomonadaceae bacterium]